MKYSIMLLAEFIKHVYNEGAENVYEYVGLTSPEYGGFHIPPSNVESAIVSSVLGYSMQKFLKSVSGRNPEILFNELAETERFKDFYRTHIQEALFRENEFLHNHIQRLEQNQTFQMQQQPIQQMSPHHLMSEMQMLKNRVTLLENHIQIGMGISNTQWNPMP